MQKRIFLIVLFLVVFISIAAGQYLGPNKQSGVGIPFFEIAFQQRFAPDLEHHRLIVMTSHLFDDLTFIKSDTSGFDTEFEMLFAVYDKKGNVVTSRTINRKINVPNFDMTNSRDSVIVIKEAFKLPAGEYSLLAKSTDLITNESAKRKIKFTFKEFKDKPVAIGSLLFLQRVTLDSAGQVVDFIPTFSNNFAVKAGKFYIYFDVFAKEIGQPVTLRYIFKGEKRRSKKQITEIDSMITVVPNTHIFSQLFELRRDRLKRNKYFLTVEAIVGKKKAQTSQIFSFFWSTVPSTQEDIDLALQQMSYILNADTLKKYLKAPLKEKQAFFERFWKERDPDPSTAKNELKDEYFRRVNYANTYFSTMTQDGWATDRGRILIKFGFPDDIERHPFEIDSPPYEIWQYYNLRKTFLFVDYTGFGDYRLDPRYFDVEYE
ncbi:MAG: GWxTD domain-containing protein [Caldisericaceae bacterium]|nr:GWxTD domain-containing protein [Caldisericaceae bacterium]